MEKETKYPSRTADQFVVRLPDGMRDQIAEAAKSNNRSMNAEIVARLLQSFDAPASAHQDRIYILLDSNGYPQSWAEIHEYLRAINKSGKLSPVDLEIHVVTPDMESSSRRAKEAAELAKHLRREGKSRPIDNEA